MDIEIGTRNKKREKREGKWKRVVLYVAVLAVRVFIYAYSFSYLTSSSLLEQELVFTASFSILSSFFFRISYYTSDPIREAHHLSAIATHLSDIDVLVARSHPLRIASNCRYRFKSRTQQNAITGQNRTNQYSGVRLWGVVAPIIGS